MSSQAQTYAYGVAIGLTAGGFECNSCETSRWGNPTPTARIECLNCGDIIDTLLLVDDPQIALALRSIITEFDREQNA